MWECGFNALRQSCQQLRDMIKGHDTETDVPLEPRHAFFGGRTNCTTLYHEANIDAGETIRYLDVCSLYPWACKYGVYPVGHPTITVGDDCPKTLDNVEGVVKAAVLPPQQLYHPVLPVRVHDRLMFPLCRSCAEELRMDDCNHREDQRIILGTWVSHELKKAVDMGYKVICTIMFEDYFEHNLIMLYNNANINLVKNKIYSDG